MRISLPPEREQRRIAEILDTIDTVIQQTEAVIAKLKQMKAGLLHDLLTRGLDENGELRDPVAHPEQFKDLPLEKIPREWTIQSLSHFASRDENSFVNAPFGSDLLTSELRSEGVPVIYVRDIKPGRYDRVSSAHVSPQKAVELSFCNVRQDDVLVAKVGDPPCDAAPYTETETAVVTQDVIRIRPNDDVHTNFLVHAINSSVGRRAVETIAIAGTRKRVSLREFKRVPLPKPPFPEQIHIIPVWSDYAVNSS